MRDNFFGSPANPSLAPLQQTIDGLSAAAQQRGGFATPNIVTVSMESLNPNSLEASTRNDSLSGLRTAVQECRAGIQGLAKLSIAQEQAAVAAGFLSYNPAAHNSRAVKFANLTSFASDQTVVVSHADAASSAAARQVAFEGFDERNNGNVTAFSMAYNMNAARQDAFGETLFPTVVVAPDQNGYEVTQRLMFVQDEVRRNTSGALDNFNRRNLLHAVIDSSILRNDQTKLIPVYRKTLPTAAPTDSDTNFALAADVPSYAVVVDGQSITTAPLLPGKKLNLLGISQTAATLAAGQMDNTDSIDSAPHLGALYIRLGAGVGSEVVKFTVDKYPPSAFNAVLQGNTQEMALAFRSEALKVTSTMLAVDNSAIASLAPLTTSTVRLSVSFFGNVTLDKGDLSTTAGAVSVSAIFDDQGVELSQASGTGLTIANVFTGSTIVGYDLKAYRTNSNRRQRGQLIDTQYVKYLYTVPRLPPITHLRPTGTDDVSDSEKLASLITATRVTAMNAAVTELLRAKDFIKEVATSTDPRSAAPQVFGAASQLIFPSYEESALNCVTAIDSLSSAGRAEDLTALLFNKIRDMASILYTRAGLKAAETAANGGVEKRPLIIVATDTTIERYLTINGDTRLAGDAFDFKVVSTQDSRMAGKIIVVFGDQDALTSGAPNTLHFGNMAWKPELTLALPTARNGANVMELTVAPSFLHITNTPVMGVIEVTNISAVIAGKNVIYNKVVV